MLKLLEPGVAFGLAVSLHLLAVGPLLQNGGSTAAGQGGEALVTLAPADAGVAALVAAWQQPPAVAMIALLPDQPDPATGALAAPQPDQPPAALVPPPAPPTLAPPPTAEPTVAPLAAPAPPAIETAAVIAAPQAGPRPRPKARPAPQPQAKAASRPTGAQPAVTAQKAAGTGATAQAGQQGRAAVATLSASATQGLQVGWGAQIRARIERKKAYPRDGGGAKGTATLQLVVAADGRLQAVAVAASSGSAALDAAALRAVKTAGRFPGSPKGLTLAQATFLLNISFRR